VIIKIFGLLTILRRLWDTQFARIHIVYILCYLIPGFYVIQSVKEKRKLENHLFFRKMGQFRPISLQFERQNAILYLIGKRNKEMYTGSNFHPMGEIHASE